MRIADKHNSKFMMTCWKEKAAWIWPAAAFTGGRKKTWRKWPPNWRFYSLAHPFFITTLNCPSHLLPSYHQFYLLSPFASFSSSSLMPCTHPLHLFNTFLIFLFISPTSLTSPPPVLLSLDFPLSTCPSLLASIHPPASILVLSLPGPWQW